MSPAQRDHIEQIVERFKTKAIIKYEAGCIEYGNNIWEQPLPWLLDALEEELVDAYVYLHTIRELTS